MNTNGGIRNTGWWNQIGLRLNQPQDYVVFSIDGLKDTNHIYRRNVDWNQVLTNAQAFITTGGSAHWDMLVYQHNQHQVFACEQLARDMGFKWFRAKVSKRHVIGNLQYPVDWVSPPEKTGPVDCFALKEQSIYIDAQGRISPCCWLGSRQQDFDFKDVATELNPVCRATCRTNSKQTAFTAQWQKEIALC
jgi:sulfatase maturation enzyme AslB (radical SAM superfamily)